MVWEWVTRVITPTYELGKKNLLLVAGISSHLQLVFWAHLYGATKNTGTFISWPTPIIVFKSLAI